MGTSSLMVFNMFRAKDHPHAYGDKLLSIPGVTDGVGSSPRVWGQENQLMIYLNLLRIIPTRMGTSEQQ